MKTKTEKKHLIKLIDILICNYKYKLNEEKYYLFYKVNTEIVNCFEEFLLGDNEVEQSDLYKHIEAVKKSKYIETFNYLIEKVEERRNNNMHLQNIPTFTVWKILTYVRNKNINNKVVLGALDKYYNLDRCVLTSSDCECGYVFRENCFNDSFDYPTTTLTSFASSNGIMFNYGGNEFEKEDSYYNFEEKDVKEENINEYLSSFANKLYKIDRISSEAKKQLLKEQHKTYSLRTTK